MRRAGRGGRIQASPAFALSAGLAPAARRAGVDGVDPWRDGVACGRLADQAATGHPRTPRWCVFDSNAGQIPVDTADPSAGPGRRELVRELAKLLSGRRVVSLSVGTCFSQAIEERTADFVEAGVGEQARGRVNPLLDGADG